MTKILQVLTEYCNPYVDDIRLAEKQADNPPVYAWTMWQYLKPQMARFTVPVEMGEYLHKDLVEPRFDSFRYVAADTLTAPTVVSLGEEYKGFELFSAHLLTLAKNLDLLATATDLISYNANDGTITVNASAEQPVELGTMIDLDFYTDGEFAQELSPEIMTILGICFECGWNTRFENDWLSNVSKVEDRSSYQQNIANRMAKGSERLVLVERKLAGAMRRFEQNAYYRTNVSSGSKLKI